ncbi:probable nuclear transport factor 2 [Aplysia californica]|uniref:Nuclear transport factor 2 n=1 Tax=Aplysia californica TaxID=6500 RepID=A0ABM0JDK5_APLCA|nr:probable nuclear transport factor 2 [Aplysia californica]
MNPHFEMIGKSFAEQYYACFDNKDTREKVAAMYSPNEGMLSFEGQQFQGAAAIGEKMKTVPLDNMLRVISTIDCQPMMDGGVIVSVLGQLKNNDDNDKVLPFSQTFVLKPANNSFFIYHDIFRLVLHNL